MTPAAGALSQAAAGARRLGPHRSVFGESALWDDRSCCIWSVDMHGHAIVQTFEDGTTRVWKTPAPRLPWARAVVLREGGGLIVALGDRLAALDPSSGVFAHLPVIPDLPVGHLFNDATVNSRGRLIIGTMLPGRGDDGQAIIQQYAYDRSPRPLLDGFNATNGLAFSPDGATIYFSDSRVGIRKVWAAHYDPVDGTMSNRRMFVDFAALSGKPDGAAVDLQGGYWSAAMGSRCVYRFTSDGMLDHTVSVPVDTPTRPAFGGATFKTLYVSTGGLKSGEVDDGLKGAMFEQSVPFAGMKSNRARL